MVHQVMIREAPQLSAQLCAQLNYIIDAELSLLAAQLSVKPTPSIFVRRFYLRRDNGDL